MTYRSTYIFTLTLYLLLRLTEKENANISNKQ